jgi:23S rRNA (uridine2552-2'-O)-methyltransferase
MPRPGQPDHYRKRAQAEGYVARAIYKLKEVDEKYHLFKAGQRVLDLGCSPGSWLQYIGSRIGPRGLVVGIDVNPLEIKVAPPLYFMQAEIGSIDFKTLTAISPVFDVVVSDMAPKTTGMRQVDQQRSLDLAWAAWEWAEKLLHRGGHFLVKVFEGPDTGSLMALLKANFKSCRPVKPAGSRPASREIYLLGLNRRGAPVGDQNPPAGSPLP